MAETGQTALGVRFVKEPRKTWPTAYWAVVGGTPRVVVDKGVVLPPKTYDEARALRHLLEAIATAVREHGVKKTLVWQIETNARLNQTMCPRLRGEGAACAAAASAASDVKLVGWSQVAAGAEADKPKAEYEAASVVCGVKVGQADPYAVLVAVAALGARTWK